VLSHASDPKPVSRDDLPADESRDTFNEAMIRTLEGQRRTNTPNEPEVA